MRICVFLGSSLGLAETYQQCAQELGICLANAGVGIVYGGASIGLMGVMADAAIRNGGEVIGVIPERLAWREVLRSDLTELHVVKSMHERKAKMAELSDAFITLPGGIGTLEEFFEIWTWAQLGFHTKPCGLLNVDGFYDGLIKFLVEVKDNGFIQTSDINLIHWQSDPMNLIQILVAYVLERSRKNAFSIGET